MRKIFSVIVLSLVVAAAAASGRFVRVEGENLVKPDGTKLYITGTNLGNWLNPEGYMFGFQKTNCEWMIDLMLKEMVGPDEAAAFWRVFKDNYITRDDIRPTPYVCRSTTSSSPTKTTWAYPPHRTVSPVSTA